jgi:hypothetical protein
MLRGAIPRPEHVAVFFADTHDEHGWTYRAVGEVETRCHAADVRFIRCEHKRGGLGDHLINAAAMGAKRMDNPPVYIRKPSGARGQATQKCSREFKRDVLRRAKRAWLREIRLPKSCRIGRYLLTSWVGFAADELHRAQAATTDPDVLWERLAFPAIRAGVTREQQRAQLTEWTGRAPRFSMCVFCPHKTVERWRDTSGADLERAIVIDEALRNLDEVGLTQGEAFLSDQLIPLRDLMQRIDEEPEAEMPRRPCTGARCFL